MAARLRLGRPPADWLFPAAVVLVATLAAWPALAEPGLLSTRGGGDSPFLLQRLHQLTTALVDGHFPVRWMPDAGYGYGYPFYNYYAPLSIYIAAAFRFIGFSFVRAIHLAQWSGFVVAGLAMFYLARRRLGSPWAGLLAAAAYTAAPFHMVNVYVRGDSLAEFWAMAFYPLVLLAAEGLTTGYRPQTTDDRPQTTDRRPQTVDRRQTNQRWPFARPLALFALAYAALILSHNISALIFSPFLLLYLVFSLWQGSRAAGEQGSRAPGSPRATLLIVIAGLLLAFALAAWFFVPALAEQASAQLGPVTEGFFHYGNHFRRLDLIQGGLLFDYDPDGGRAFRMGLLQTLLAIAGAAVLVWRAKRQPAGRAFTLFLLAGFVVATLMITPLSRPLWDHLPLLSFTQFPWRFLSVQAFFAALLTGGLAQLPGRAAAPLLAVLGSVVLLAAALLGLRTDHLILTDADVTAERLAQYEWFTGNIGTTVSAEYLTPAAAPRPWTSAWLNDGDRDRETGIAGELIAAAPQERSATRQEWAVEAGPGGATVLLPTLYWPGWRAELDGQPVGLAAQPGSGLMSLALPEGAHALTLELGRTPVRAAAEWLSLIAAIVVITLLFAGQRLGDRSRLAVRGLSSVVLFTFALALFALAWRDDPRELPPGDLTWDFAQMAYLHHTPGGVAFEDGARLYEYGYSAETARAGTTLTVTLSVAPGDGRAATLALVTPASARPTGDTAEPPVLVTATRPFDNETLVFTLPLPADAPPGLYVPRLTLDGARPLMPSGGTRGDLFLRPVRVLPGDDDATPGDALDVRATGLAMRDATTLDGRFAWHTARSLGSRYAFSWRLQDAAGATLAQLDAQPGYGFQPSPLWPAGQWTADWLTLRLPEAAPATGDYPLVMRLYDPNGGRVVLMRRVGLLSWDGEAWRPRPHEPAFALPGGLTATEATFGDPPLIALRGYAPAHTEDTLRLTVYWEALADRPGDYTRFVHLIAPDGTNAAQVDGAPAGDSYPTGQWLPGEVVADEVVFDLAALPAGTYRLAVGFYAPTEGLPRLPAAGPSGPLPDGRFLLPDFLVRE